MPPTQIVQKGQYHAISAWLGSYIPLDGLQGIFQTPSDGDHHTLLHSYLWSLHLQASGSVLYCR
jgi:hypothetical protein